MYSTSRTVNIYVCNENHGKKRPFFVIIKWNTFISILWQSYQTLTRTQNSKPNRKCNVAFHFSPIQTKKLLIKQMRIVIVTVDKKINIYSFLRSLFCAHSRVWEMKIYVQFSNANKFLDAHKFRLDENVISQLKWKKKKLLWNLLDGKHI